MPTSQHYQLSKIIQTIKTLNPYSVLDIGVGFGKYGVLCREYLELYDGRNDYHNFKRRIDGIEVFEEYITPLHRFVYSNIYIGNALELSNELDCNYDLILLIDVLEHFNKTDGKALIINLLRKHKGILISIPKYVGIQKGEFCNPYEEHKSRWSKKELTELKRYTFNSQCLFCINDNSNYIVYIGKKDNIEKIKNADKELKKYFLIRNIKQCFGGY